MISLFDGQVRSYLRKQALMLAAMTMTACTVHMLPVDANPVTPAPKRAAKVSRDDVLLVMPNAGAEQEEIADALKEAHGEVVGEMQVGTMKILLVKSEPGKAEQTEAKLRKDQKHFASVDANHRIYADYVPLSEPGFGASWHLTRMHCPEAWDVTKGIMRSGPIVAVLDSGCAGPEVQNVASHGADVTSAEVKKAGGFVKTAVGTGFFEVEDVEKQMTKLGNAIEMFTNGTTDRNGHGTWVGSSVAGSENRRASLGINPSSPIFPIKIADGAMGTKIYTDDLALLTAFSVLYQKMNTRIVNISYGGLMNKSKHSVLHKVFKDFYERKNGLIFVSAGNAGEFLDYDNAEYLNVVSAMAHTRAMQLVHTRAWSSAFGPAVDFTAPGQDIVVANPNGTQTTVDGTSFASPICAGVASLIWTVKPNLPNRIVEWVMRASCVNTTKSWNNKFGYGMPDAQRAVEIAQHLPLP